MKLRLEAFEKVSILFVSQTIGYEDARILLAGVSKLASLGRPWVLVDFGHAILEDQAIYFISEHFRKTLDAPPSAAQIRCVGSLASFCQYDDLETALEKLRFRELKDVAQKMDLEMNRESLSRLLSARERVLGEVEGKGRGIASLEAEFLILNRNLRAAQTHLINRLLDPVFADLWMEPAISSDAANELMNVFPRKAALSGGESSVRQAGPTASATTEAADNSDLYLAANLADKIGELRSENQALSAKARKSFLDGKADRLVSLYMENEAIRTRIREVREVWLQKLEADPVPTALDFESGFRPLIDAIAEEKETASKKKAKAA